MLTIAASLVRSKVAAVTVGAVGVGLTAVYQAIAGLMTNLCNLGLFDSGVQVLSKEYASNDPARVHKTVGMLRLWELMTGTAAMLLTMLFSPLLCRLYFGDPFSHWHSVLLLSLVPFCSIVTGIEMVVLKSLQRTQKLTLSITIVSVSSIVIALPLYFLMGMHGIVFILVASAVSSALITAGFAYSVDSTKPDIMLIRSGLSTLWKASEPTIMIGITLVITGVASMGTEFVLQTYISTVATLAVVGFYKTGYLLSITYPSLVFTAVNNDYYPRLASLSSNTMERNILISRQTVTLLLIVTPCILLFVCLVPWIVPLLLSDEFRVIVPMVQIGVVSVIVKSVSLPLCYVPLATGQKWDFVVMELVSYAGLVACVIIGYHESGLLGIGYGILFSNFIDFLYSYVLCKRKYAFHYVFK